MPTTASGLPYPSGDDVPDGPEALRALAEAVESKMSIQVVQASFRGPWDGSVKHSFTTSQSGVLRGLVSVSAYHNVNLPVVVDCRVDGTYVGKCELEQALSVNVHMMLSPCSFNIAIGAGTHTIALLTTAGYGEVKDIGTVLALFTKS